MYKRKWFQQIVKRRKRGKEELKNKCTLLKNKSNKSQKEKQQEKQENKKMTHWKGRKEKEENFFFSF